MAEKLEELQLPRAQVEIESRGAIYAVPFFEDAELEKPSLSPEDALGPGAWHPPLDTSVSPAVPFPTAAAVPEAGVPRSCGAEPGSRSPAEEEGATGAVGECPVPGHKPSRTGRSSGHGSDARAGVQRGATGTEVPVLPGEVRGARGCLSCRSHHHPFGRGNTHGQGMGGSA